MKIVAKDDKQRRRGDGMFPSGPVRLADPIAAGKLLWCYCCACGHERHRGALPLSPATPVPDVRYSMRCTRCGAKKADTRPELYAGGIEKMRAARRYKS